MLLVVKLPFEMGYYSLGHLLALQSMAFLHFVSLKVVEKDKFLNIKLNNTSKFFGYQLRFWLLLLASYKYDEKFMNIKERFQDSIEYNLKSTKFCFSLENIDSNNINSFLLQKGIILLRVIENRKTICYTSKSFIHHCRLYLFFPHWKSPCDRC